MFLNINIKSNGMKKLLLSSLSIILLAQANAQITLTASTSTPQLGDNLTYKSTAIDLSDFLETSTGMNQTWDLSNLDDVTTQEYDYEYSSVSSFTYSNLFPNCTIGIESVSLAGQDSESYLETNATGIRVAGAYIDGSDVMEQTEGLHLLKFPMTLNTTYTDSIKGGTALLVTGGIEFERKGVSTLTGDGYGSLILPYGTVHDVLRVKIVREYDDYALGMNMFTFIETSYYYYTNYNNNFIATTNHLTVAGTPIMSNFQYQTEESFNNLGQDQFTPNNEVSLYPNPAINQFTIKNIEENSTAEIVDLNGRTMKTVTVSSNTPIDISDLSKGYYVVNITNSNKNLVKKLIVQ